MVSESKPTFWSSDPGSICGRGTARERVVRQQDGGDGTCNGTTRGSAAGQTCSGGRRAAVAVGLGRACSNYLQCEAESVARLGVSDDICDVDGNDPLAERVRPRRAAPLAGDRVIVEDAPRFREESLPTAILVEAEEGAGVRVLLPVECDVDLRAGGTGGGGTGGGGQRHRRASRRPLEGTGAAAPARRWLAEHHQRWASARRRSGRAAESRYWRQRWPAHRWPL